MKKVTTLLLLLVLFTACKDPIQPSELSKINGYWEIEKVELPDGNHKDYGINDTYDYFEIKGDKGFRKKVMPQLDGTYLVNDVSEQVQVLNENRKTFLEYSTPYAKWKEELLEISETQMVLRNSQNNEYHYKKAQALNLSPDGKKTP